MSEPLGDKLFWIAIIILVFTFICGWIILLGTMLLQRILPSSNDKLERFLQRASKPLGIIQKYSIYCGVALFLIRLIAGWLGWAPPLSSIEE